MGGTRLKKANLKLRIKKCCLFQQRVSFLGHVLTKSGIEVQPDKVEAVQNWPTPRNLTELRPLNCRTLFLLSEIHWTICWHRCSTPSFDKEARILQVRTWRRPSFQRVKAMSNISTYLGYASRWMDILLGYWCFRYCTRHSIVSRTGWGGSCVGLCF